MNQPLKLPHLEPLKFAKSVIGFENKAAVVQCEFPEIPTKGMIIEAAAQSSAAFQQGDTPRIGFLASVRDISYHGILHDTVCRIKIEEIHHIDHFYELDFEVMPLADEVKLVSGKLTIVVHDASDVA